MDRDKLIMSVDRKYTVDQRLYRSIQAMGNYSTMQLDALCGNSPMTMSLLRSCLDTCVKSGNTEDIFTILQQFPELAEAYFKVLNRSIKEESSNL